MTHRERKIQLSITAILRQIQTPLRFANLGLNMRPTLGKYQSNKFRKQRRNRILLGSNGRVEVSHIIHLRWILPVDDDLTAVGGAIDDPVAVARLGVDELQIVTPNQAPRLWQRQGASASLAAG